MYLLYFLLADLIQNAACVMMSDDVGSGVAGIVFIS